MVGLNLNFYQAVFIYKQVYICRAWAQTLGRDGGGTPLLKLLKRSEIILQSSLSDSDGCVSVTVDHLIYDVDIIDVSFRKYSHTYGIYICMFTYGLHKKRLILYYESGKL